MRKLLAGLAAGLCLLLGAAQADAQSRWATQGVRIATEGAYAPWNFSKPDGSLDGFEVELHRELCRRMGVRCTIVAQDWDGIIPSLNAGRYDAIMAGMNITPRRLEAISFSRPYASGPGGFGVPKDSPLARMAGTGSRINLDTQAPEARAAFEALRAAVRGRTIGVQGSTTHANLVNEHFKDVATIREYRTTEQHDLDLQNGRIDAIWAAHSAMSATFAQPGFEGFVIVGPGFSGGVLGAGVAVGVRKADNDLREMFSKAIGEALADGTVRTLSLKWFNNVDLSPQQ
ncbi:MAG: transporter substrate-binding domain-containing protein [Acetobacteraceae bacterium]|nr:transporter substrate-binding domain-containing protein [Acetobacteraceae bacterium]